MKNSWNKVVALMLAAALCVSCGVTGFAEDTQTDENTEIVEVVEQQNQEEPPKEEAPEPVQEPEPAPVQEEPKEEPAPAPVKEEPKAEPAPEAPKAEEPKAEPAPAPVTEAPKAEPAPEAPKAEEPKAEPAPAPVTEEPKAEEPKKAEETKAEEPKAEEPKAEETKAEEPKAEEPKTEEPKTEETKPEEKPVEQPTVPVTKVEQPAVEAPATDEVKTENITVHIEWEDEDNAIGLRPTTLAVTLSGSDGQTYSATIAEKDGWQHTFADLTTLRGAEVIYYSVDADDVTDYDKDVRGLTVTYTCTAQPVAEEKPIIDEQPAAEDENLIDDQMDGDPAELPDGDGPTVTETEDGTVIDMGETAEETVEGEEANAVKPAEDGELDEDFTLPEEGELPEGDAEPEIPEIPEIDFSTLQVVIGEPQYDEDVMTLRATLIGFDNIDYALQWQFSTDDATWTDVSGATGDTLVVQLDESNAGCYWRVSAEVFGWKTLPTEQAAQE